ncbi:transporter substrate-binding domain-containing protein [Aeromonas veronii]
MIVSLFPVNAIWVNSYPYLANKEKVASPKQVFVFKETQMSLAFNKDTPDELITRLNEILAAMKADGTIDKINAKYQ